MEKAVKEKYKILRIEEGIYDYNTFFVEIAKNKIIQIPAIKGIEKGKQIIGKTILIPCEIDGEGYIFNRIIEKVEFV